jgi:hypothetical protein
MTTRHLRRHARRADGSRNRRGVFVYLVARGDDMRRRAVANAESRDAASRTYIQDAAATSSSPAAEVERLATLHADGVIDDTEFQTLKAQALA